MFLQNLLRNLGLACGGSESGVDVTRAVSEAVQRGGVEEGVTMVQRGVE